MARGNRENKATYEYEKDGQSFKVEKPLTAEEVANLTTGPAAGNGKTEDNNNDGPIMDADTYSLYRLEEKMTGGAIHTMKVWKESKPNDFSAYCGALAIPSEVDPENPHEAIRRRLGRGRFMVKFPTINRQTGDIVEKTDFIIIETSDGDPTSINLTLPTPAVATGNPQMDGFIQYMIAQSKLEAERMRDELRHEREMRREELKADRERQERLEVRMQEMQKRDPLDIGNIAKALATVRDMFQPRVDPKDALIQVMVLKKLKEISKEEGVEQGLVDKVMNNPLLAQKASEVIDVILSRSGKATLATGAPGSSETLPAQSSVTHAENEQEALRMEIENFWLSTVMSTAAKGGDPFTCAEFIRQRFGANIVQVIPLLGISVEAMSKNPADLSGFFQKYPNALNFREFFDAVFYYLMNANATPMDEEEEGEPETEDRVQ